MIAWNSSSAIARRCLRASAMRAGRANTSAATRAVSRAVRTAGKPSANLALAERVGVEAQLRLDRAEQVGGPALQPADRRVGGDQRLRVGFEEADVRAGRGDRDLDGEDLLARQAAHHVADQRRLAVAARRDQEHLLAGGEVAAEPLALVLAVGERRRGDDFAVDERVVAGYVSAPPLRDYT